MARLGWLLLGLGAFTCCCSLLQVAGYYQVMDCCLRTTSRPIPYKLLRGYREQYIQEGCPVRAVVFITVKGRQLCAPPHAPWVKQLKERLDLHLKVSEGDGLFRRIAWLGPSLGHGVQTWDALVSFQHAVELASIVEEEAEKPLSSLVKEEASSSGDEEEAEQSVDQLLPRSFQRTRS
ncbi:UNVERIFIED_CONTAM: hypothetical protein K2H54_068186, partial [Gekko kuhli]